MPPVSAQDPPSFVKVQERNAHGVPPPQEGSVRGAAVG